MTRTSARRTWLPALLPLLVAGPGLAQSPIANPANGHTYVRINQPDYNLARATAATMGGYLVSVNNAAEQAFLVANFPAAAGAGNRPFIGLTDQVTEGVFLWDSGEPVTYTNWAAGEPNNLNGEDFVEILDGSLLWNDCSITSCGAHYCIVEIAGPPPPPPGPEYQLNTSQASLSVNGVQGTGTAPVVLTLPAGSVANISLTSFNTWQPWDVGYGAAALVPRSAPGALIASDGQVVNLNLSDPTLGLMFNGFTGPWFQPIAAGLPLPAPTSVSMQMIIIAPVNPSGIALSQAVRLVVF